MSLRNVVSKNLRQLRSRKKLSQDDVARRSGISVSYVSMLERGNRVPPLETIEALAKALKVPPLSLFQDSGGHEPRRR